MGGDLMEEREADSYVLFLDAGGIVDLDGRRPVRKDTEFTYVIDIIKLSTFLTIP
jgi:hypothetical protein